MNRITELARHLNLNELLGEQFREQVQLLLKQKANGKKKTGPKPKVQTSAADSPALPPPLPAQAISPQKTSPR